MACTNPPIAQSSAPIAFDRASVQNKCFSSNSRS